MQPLPDTEQPNAVRFAELVPNSLRIESVIDRLQQQLAYRPEEKYAKMLPRLAPQAGEATGNGRVVAASVQTTHWHSFMTDCRRRGAMHADHQHRLLPSCRRSSDCQQFRRRHATSTSYGTVVAVIVVTVMVDPWRCSQMVGEEAGTRMLLQASTIRATVAEGVAQKHGSHTMMDSKTWFFLIGVASWIRTRSPWP